MSTNKASFAAAMESLTITLTSVGTGTYRASAEVNNSVTRYLDMLLEMSLTFGGVPTGDVEVYLAASGDGSFYPAGVTGADDAPTITDPAHLSYLGTIKGSGAGPLKVVWPTIAGANAALVLPPFWCIVLRNLTGQNISAGSLRWLGQQITEE